MITIPREAAAIAKVAAKEDARWALSGVKVKETEKGYRLEATNGCSAMVLEGSSLHEQFPDVPGIDRERKGKEALLPAKELAAHLKAVKKTRYGNPVFSTALLSIGERSVQVVSTDLSTTKADEIRVLEGSFPPLDEIVPPKGAGKVRIAFGAELLSNLLKALAEATPEGPRSLSGRTVVFEIKDKYSAVRIDASYDDVVAVGVIMPVLED